MKQSWLNFSLWLTLCTLAWANKDHYCSRNITVRTTHPVTKQRTVIKQPPKWKIWKKPQTITEVYNTHEERITNKLLTECCPGYSQTEGGLCEPICAHGCPAFASCVEPQSCQCTPGYVSAQSHRDGSHYCEPVCERPCAQGAHCVAPNTCACREGFAASAPTDDGVSGPCKPVCSLGDGCANGQCIEPEVCKCLAGYLWDEEELICAESAETVEDELEEFTEIDTQLFVEQSTASAITSCGAGFVLYAGECRPEKFDSSEAPVVRDCRLADPKCGAHQRCNEQGSCVCADGYTAQENTHNSTLTCQRGLLEELLSIDQAANEDDGELNPLTIPIIGVASGSLFVLLLVGLFTGLRRRRQQQETGALPKEGLQCEYSQKSYDVDEWVP